MDFYEAQRELSGVEPQHATDAEFFTQASILAAAASEVQRNAIWATFDGVTARNPYRPGIELPISSLDHGIGFGSTERVDQNHARPEPAWWLSQTVRSCLTFETIVSSMSSEKRLVDVMSSASKAGRSHVHVRLLRFGEGAVVPVERDPARNYDALVSAFGWRIAETSAGMSDILVTPALIPRREFRAWVVKGELVAGAGIVPGLDPRYGTGTALDLQNTESRGSGSVSISDPSDVEGLAELTRTLISENSRGGDLPESFVVDLAWDGDLPTIIDLNSINGTALYAANPARIIRALVS